ncbi:MULTISPECIES: MarR family transcriptional regulator [unclassified Halorubrum]|uniref:winged helix-turn-helix transcriptional regulator n=1 Tax=unclassified Halorubrum TaxID=2642239 RepID=UPI000EF1E7D0|nr:MULTISPECIES: MarR family transcriptional regulator [unclassified Halorubrum]RLM52456.1 MarR family transcriptional regulator [Halorubrum sp. Atlit-28R]TKX44253.1 MarR family transcriptional regulator [Halorubrum sp. ARQ200]TKX50839.1 MarR family transcriptional regulator [Halorubrum sp. ASP121]TKX63588.1 MarR family transcriptional regulator [Halorubrum sp. ASP1]
MTEGFDGQKRETLRRFAAVGAAAPFVGTASADDEGGDGNETREAIRGYVPTTPGAHFSKLRDDLRLGTGEAQYHLRKLEEAGAIESVKDDDYRRFFPAGRFDETDKRALGYLRRETPRGMILALLRDPDATGADLASALGVSRPAISAAAADLERAGLLDRTDGYALTEPERLLTLVVRYADSFDAAAVAVADDAASLVSYDP